MKKDSYESKKFEEPKLIIQEGKLNFICLGDKCPNNCCGPFGGVQRGIDSIDGKKFSEIILTPEDSKRLLESGCSNLIELTSNGGYRMRTEKDGTCVALKDGLCTIHHLKPTLCRAFPFYIDMFVGLCGITDCPGFGEGWTDLNSLDGEIKAAGEMYKFWVDSIQIKNQKDSSNK